VGRRRIASLLAAAAALVVLAASATASAADYVAMGDSYSSGTGTRDYYDPSCERRKLRRNGVTTVRARVRFTPRGGAARTKSKDIKLVREGGGTR